jgi:hypothetical protein
LEVSGQLHSQGKNPQYPLDRRTGGPLSISRAIHYIFIRANVFPTQHFEPEDGENMFFWNISDHPPH